MTASVPLPERPPFVLRARVLTPLADGGSRYEPDGAIDVDAGGRIVAVGPWPARPAAATAGRDRSIDLRPLVVLPGMVDLHVHLPQLPNAGVGAGLDLLTWLERYIFPLEREFDAPTAERLAPAAFRAMAAAGTTTALIYGAVFEPSLDAAFRAAEAHGIRAIIGKVMMDRLTYDDRLPADRILETSLRQSADLCARWHGRDDGRLQLRVHAAVRGLVQRRDAPRVGGARRARPAPTGRPTCPRTATSCARSPGSSPKRIDYLDVYDRAGGLGPRTILAHAIHLSPREVARLAESGTRVAHCPASNLFLASGAMPLARYRAAGIRVGLGSDVAGGSGAVDLRRHARRGLHPERPARAARPRRARPAVGPLDWLRLGTLEGARALGLDGRDRLARGRQGGRPHRRRPAPRRADPRDRLATIRPRSCRRLIFRPHPAMVRAAWVRGRRLEGPPGLEGRPA